MICVEGRKEGRKKVGWLVGCQRISEFLNFIYFLHSKVSTTILIRSHRVEACEREGGEFIREHHQN